MYGRGNGHTALKWEKARWAGELQGKTWKLNWLSGERFEIDETPETTDDDAAGELLGLVRANPGGSWNTYVDDLHIKAKRKQKIRDRLLEEGRLVNAGSKSSMQLYAAEDAPEPSWPEVQQATLELQQETGTHGHPLADVIERARENQQDEEASE